MLTENVEVDFFDKKVKMVIYDYDYYFNNNINNDGLDIISKCIKGNDNCWEPYQTEITKRILENGNNIFIDIGCHLGYYSLLAASLNNIVYSIDVNENTSKIFKENVKINNYDNNIIFLQEYVNVNFKLFNIPNETPIKLIKCDIEGNEIEFVDIIIGRLQNKTIDYLILEISPNFRDNYSECVLKIKNLGYDIYDIGLSPQRKLDDTTNLTSLKNKLVDINNLEDMRNYINNFPEKQSNFLFTHLKL